MHKPAKPLEGPDTYNDQIRIVLVETSHSGNIGAVARAMKNMGMGNLWLVNPVSFPDEASYARAAGASDILDKATVVSTLDDAIADCVCVMVPAPGGERSRGRSLLHQTRRPRPPNSRKRGRWHWSSGVRTMG